MGWFLVIVGVIVAFNLPSISTASGWAVSFVVFVWALLTAFLIGLGVAVNQGWMPLIH